MPLLKFGKDFDNSKVKEDLKDLMTKDPQKYKELTTLTYGNFGEFQLDLMSYLEEMDCFCEYKVFQERDFTSADEYVDALRGTYEVIERPFNNKDYINLERHFEDYVERIKKDGMPWLNPLINVLDLKVYEVKEIDTWVVTIQVRGYNNKMLVVFDDAYCDHEDSIDYIYNPQGDCLTFYAHKELGDGYKLEFCLDYPPLNGGVSIYKYKDGAYQYGFKSTSDTMEGIYKLIEEDKKKNK